MMLTIVIGNDGHIYNISNDEHPPIVWGNKEQAIVKAGSIPKDAYYCSEEEYVRMMNKRGQKIEPNGRTLAEIHKEWKEQLATKKKAKSEDNKIGKIQWTPN